MSDEHHHEHEHEHGRVLVDEDGLQLSLLEHEGSLVASYRLQLATDFATGQERLTEFATQLADAVTEAGGLVGHIKMVVSEPGKSVRISVTAHDPDIKELAGRGTKVEGVAIVMLVEHEWFAAEVERRLRELM